MFKLFNFAPPAGESIFSVYVFPISQLVLYCIFPLFDLIVLDRNTGFNILLCVSFDNILDQVDMEYMRHWHSLCNFLGGHL